MSIWSGVLDLLFPRRCALCGKLLSGTEQNICAPCCRDLPEMDEAHRVRQGAFGRCAVSLWYEDMVRDGIHGLKFGGRRGAASVFAGYMAETVALHFAGEFDMVTYVPVSDKRLRNRGYDQSRLLAERMARIWSVKAEELLWKTVDNPPQSSLTSSAARRGNVLGVYDVRPKANVAGRRVLLVDDVLTTGSTMTECVRVLRMAGAESVVCATLAVSEKERKSGGEKK